uniref:PHF7/G2E3-like PHD zinc finger domain-containing protein n=1 Tax=Strix occidentalis caurina TaxID=311401 RepID=A0A8D0F9E5_STROC
RLLFVLEALGNNPSGTLPPAPQRCSFPSAFALSPPACVLCGRAAADPDLCGHKEEEEGLCAHLFCLVSLPQQRNEDVGLMGFLPEDIHRAGRASCAGIAFRCPLCRDRNEFLPEMFFMGINMPLRLVSCRLTGQEAASPGPCQGLPLQSWPSAVPSAWASASRRGCKPGRGEEQGPWQLLLCSSCAGEGTHRRCSNLGTSSTSWECESCADQSTGKRQSTQVPLGWGQSPGKA